MESMAAVMIVVISLTAFLSFLAFSLSQETEKGTDVPTDFLNDVRIANGNIEANIEDRMTASMERHGFAGMRVTLSAADGIYDSALTLNVGVQDTDVIHTKGGTIVVKDDGGRSVPVRYSVAVWS